VWGGVGWGGGGGLSFIMSGGVGVGGKGDEKNRAKKDRARLKEKGESIPGGKYRKQERQGGGKATRGGGTAVRSWKNARMASKRAGGREEQKSASWSRKGV